MEHQRPTTPARPGHTVPGTATAATTPATGARGRPELHLLVGEGVELDADEQRAVRLLAAAGLLPTLAHREAV